MKKPKRRKPGRAKRKVAPPSVEPVARSAAQRSSTRAGAMVWPQFSPTLLLPFLILATIYAAQPGLNAGIAALTRWMTAAEPAVVAARPEPRPGTPPIIHAPVIAAPPPAIAIDTTEPDQAGAVIAHRPPMAALPRPAPAAVAATAPADPEHASDILGARPTLSIVPLAPRAPALQPWPRDPEQVASLLAARSPAPWLLPAPDATPSSPPPVDPEQVAALVPARRSALPRPADPAPTCQPGERPFAARAPVLAASHTAAADFGLELARAASAQTRELVIYNARYFSLSYPMGDVPPLFGVCTDVIIRAYRALGIDLQPLVYHSRAGRGDRHIDHRRVEVLRRFLELHAETLPISDFAEDYAPGDIVTYHRPFGRTSNAHIAIVAEVVAPSGRPMIIHNRGWGPQLEDALFADRMTGHFRYRGPMAKAAGMSVRHAAATAARRR